MYLNNEEIAQEFFISNGFNVTNVAIDGRIHRFKNNASDKGESCWYVLSQETTTTGVDCIYGAIGDHRTGQKIPVYISHLPDIAGSYTKKGVIRSSPLPPRRDYKKETVALNEKTAIIAFEYWKRLPSGRKFHPYLRKKKIERLHGAKIALSPEGYELLVPVLDIEKKFWGFQRILEDGEKLFFRGTKKSDCFFEFGSGLGGKSVGYICEGFSTGASIYQALGQSVFCSFDAGNLKRVAFQINKKFPDSRLVICGDDDIFSPSNTGRNYAEAAASSISCPVVFPKFEPADLLLNKPTDFNDLYLISGPDNVKNQIVEATK